jgi:hypothetical protein
VLDLATVGEQLGLPLGDPERQIVRRCRPVLGRHASARHVCRLGPVADRVTVRALDASGGLRQARIAAASSRLMSALMA